MDEEYVAVDDAAKQLDVSRATAWKWIRRYGIQTYRVPGNRRTLLKRSDVKRLAQPVPAEQAKRERLDRN